MPPTISIIIPTFNEVENIERAVTSALCVGNEVIVADGGSTDGTVDRIKQLDCTLCPGPKGRGQQLSEGARLASGEILLFLHADNWLPPQAKSQILDAWVRTGSGDGGLFGCFQQKIRDRRFIFRLIESGNHWRAKFQKLPYGDQGIFVSRQLYDSTGGMPRIPLMEDFEFSKKLSRFSRIQILPGPIYVDARRWEEIGPVRQTIRNWCLATRYRMGAAPQELMKRY